MKRQQRVALVIYDGKGAEVRPAVKTPEGIKDNTKVVWPIEILHKTHQDVRGYPVYFLPIEPPVLLEHQMLEQSRRAIIKGQLFKPGGDITEMLKMASSILILVVAIFIWMQYSGLSEQLNNQTLSIMTVQEQLNTILGEQLNE